MVEPPLVAAVVILGIAFCGEAYDKLKEKKLLRLAASKAERMSKLLEDVSVTVFVREPNGSRTDIEHFIEQELISRGARVLVANQQSGVAVIKKGEHILLNPEAHLSVVGTLAIKDSGTAKRVKVFTESEYEFNLRRAEYRKEWRDWDVQHNHPGGGIPEPQLRGRGFKIEKVPYLLLQFSYRVLSRDGSVLASGAEQESPPKDQASLENELRSLAARAVEALDEKNVWRHIVI